MEPRKVHKIIYDMGDKTCTFAYTDGKLSKPVKVTFASRNRLSGLSYNPKFSVRIGWDVVFIDRKYVSQC